MGVRVVHLTSVHARTDTRVFLKMCRSLVSAGFDVTLVVADGKGNDTKDGVAIVDVGARTGGRISRMTKTVMKVYRAGKSLDADIYHIHDPELIPVGLWLRLQGKKVIFDSHEDIPMQMMGKPYLSPAIKRVFALLFQFFEFAVFRFFSGVITATPFIRKKLVKINPNTIDVNNYPILGELENSGDFAKKKRSVAYVGGIVRIRGAVEMVKAMEYVDDITLELAGPISDAGLAEELKQLPGWKKVNYHGVLDRGGVRDILASAMAGMVVLQPVPNLVNAHPIKMFEYMSAGIPAIVSDFPLWREIILGERTCGCCVDQDDPKVIAEAITQLCNQPEEAARMGENGSWLVQNKFNWDQEAIKLVQMYKNLSAAH